jgi:hypothetical protein
MSVVPHERRKEPSREAHGEVGENSSPRAVSMAQDLKRGGMESMASRLRRTVPANLSCSRVLRQLLQPLVSLGPSEDEVAKYPAVGILEVEDCLPRDVLAVHRDVRFREAEHPTLPARGVCEE